jgi:predicted transcriptional regulator of viral defense system
MEWPDFLKQWGNLPAIDTENLLAGGLNSASIQVQISRWEKAGKLIQLKRGIYLLAEPYRKVEVYEPHLAGILKQPSYISLEKALEYHSLIPEAVPVYTSVTTKGPAKFISKLGVFNYRHIKKTLFWGYQSVTVNKQTAFFASPEKALLDFFYLNGLKISHEYLKEMRLQNVERINLEKLSAYGRKFKKPGILNAVKIIEKYITLYKKEEKIL